MKILGVDKALQVVERKLEEMSKPVRTQDEIAQIASISANGDKDIGKLIADAMFRVQIYFVWSKQVSDIRSLFVFANIVYLGWPKRNDNDKCWQDYKR